MISDQLLTAGTDIEVAFGVVTKILLGEEAFADSWAALWPRQVRHDAGRRTGPNVLDLVVAFVGNGRDLVNVQDFSAAATAVSGKRPTSLTLLWTCCSHNQLVLHINGDLNIVADIDPAFGGHPPSIRVCQR